MYLTAQAKLLWGDTPAVSESVLDTVAEALSMISAIDVPDDVEPMFP
nr:J19 [uncultured bacterium]